MATKFASHIKKMDKKVFEWERSIRTNTYFVSSNQSLLPHAFVQEVFATEAVFWTNPVPAATLTTMLDNSLTLGVFVVSNGVKTPVGMARMITDYATLAYLTDVYISPEHQGQGVGKWLIGCCREVCIGMEYLRFMVLLTGNEQAQALYRQELGMARLDGVEVGLTCMGARRTGLVAAASAAPSS